jgi:S1-C subfamily serine protease
MKHVAQRDQANAPPKRLPLRLIVPAGGALVAVLLVAALVAPSLLGGQGGAGGPAPDAPGAAPTSSTSTTTTTLGVTCGTWSRNWRDHCESLQLAAPPAPPTTSSYADTTTTTVAAPAPPGEGPTGPTGPVLPPAPDAPLSADWASVVAGASPAVMRVDALGTGSGTGFQVDRKGHVVTNRHVVDGATKFRVRTTGGRTLTAKLVGKSKRHDIAVLRVKGLKAKPLGWSGGKPTMGEGVLVLGFPGGPHVGAPLAASQGIVSGTGRDLESSLYQDMVQFDAAINPGNSGGPVLGIDGRIVAVATALAEEKQNMNYGVLGANARDVVKRLVD